MDIVTTLLVAVITSGAVTSIIAWLRGRRTDEAQIAELEGQAVTSWVQAAESIQRQLDAERAARIEDRKRYETDLETERLARKEDARKHRIETEQLERRIGALERDNYRLLAVLDRYRSRYGDLKDDS